MFPHIAIPFTLTFTTYYLAVFIFSDYKYSYLMTHKYRGSIVVLSISKSVEPNEERKEMTAVFSKVFSASTEIVGNR